MNCRKAIYSRTGLFGLHWSRSPKRVNAMCVPKTTGRDEPALSSFLQGEGVA